jgi:dTDP-4-dehydrorhamnose reductase
MNKVVVLGGSGMLGSMVADFLASDADWQVIATARTPGLVTNFKARLPGVEWRLLDVADPKIESIRPVIGDASWVINAIGVTKPYAHDDNGLEIERAIRVNALLPYLLGHAAAEIGARVLQITTDCVYDGIKGHYGEIDPHNPIDVYGKTKSLGEALLPNVHCLRCSIIGPEPKAYAFLLEWFLRQPEGGTVSGYTNHQWNGVTTLQFARLCSGIIKTRLILPHMQHVIPSGTISKAELLHCFAQEYSRKDITINLTEAKKVIDRTLVTANESLNWQLWEAAGYAEIPSVPQMVSELAQYDYHLAGV